MSKHLNVIEGESVEEFETLSASMHAEYQPTSETERFLVDLMIRHEWMMRRAIRMQQTLLASVANEADADPKKMSSVVRYYRTHERACTQAKRELEVMRKHKRKMEKSLSAEQARAAAVAATIRKHERQWEQILKKMPPLTNWVN